jgi:hypothetical protein
MKRTYEEALHAVQSGVKARMASDEMNGVPPDSRATSPKHLRVGINSALCDQAALAKLLIRKGVITEGEYRDAITDEANREADRYEQELGVKLA